MVKGIRELLKGGMTGKDLKHTLSNIPLILYSLFFPFNN